MKVTFCEECGCRYVVDHQPTSAVPERSTCRSHPGMEPDFCRAVVYGVSRKIEGAMWDFRRLPEALVGG